MGLLMVSKIIAPNFWGYIVDAHNKQHTGTGRLLPWALGCGCILFIALNFTESFWAISALMLGYSFFWSAVLPQIEAAVFNHLGDNRHRYGRVRVWGSIGFIVLVVLMGSLLERFGVNLLIPAISILFIMLWCNSLFVKSVQKPVTAIDTTQFRQLLTPRVIILLSLCLLSQMSHAPMYTFLSVYLQDFGYTKTAIGLLWALGVVCEVVIFIFAHRFLQRFNLIHLLIACFAVGAVRWFLLARYPQFVWVLSGAQALHAITFGLYHATVAQLINQHFTGNYQVRGQALYSSLTFGLGGAIGSFASGFIWAEYGRQNLFYLVAMIMVIVTILSLILLRSDKT